MLVLEGPQRFGTGVSEQKTLFCRILGSSLGIGAYLLLQLNQNASEIKFLLERIAVLGVK